MLLLFWVLWPSLTSRTCMEMTISISQLLKRVTLYGQTLTKTPVHKNGWALSSWQVLWLKACRTPLRLKVMRCHLHGCGDFVISISTLSELLPRFNGEPLAINILVSSVAQTTVMLVFLSLKSLIRRRTTLLLVWVSNASEMELIQPTLLLWTLLMVKSHGTSLQMISLTTSQQQDLPYMP